MSPTNQQYWQSSSWYIFYSWQYNHYSTHQTWCHTSCFSCRTITFLWSALTSTSTSTSTSAWGIREAYYNTFLLFAKKELLDKTDYYELDDELPLPDCMLRNSFQDALKMELSRDSSHVRCKGVHEEQEQLWILQEAFWRGLRGRVRTIIMSGGSKGWRKRNEWWRLFVFFLKVWWRITQSRNEWDTQKWEKYVYGK